MEPSARCLVLNQDCMLLVQTSEFTLDFHIVKHIVKQTCCVAHTSQTIACKGNAKSCCLL